MKIRYVLVLSMILSMFILSGCTSNHKAKKINTEVETNRTESIKIDVLKDFTTDNVNSIKMSCEPNVKIDLSEQQINEFLTLFHKVKILNIASQQVLTGQMIHFTFTMKDNSTNIVDEINPYIIVNGNWYEVDYEPCEQINKLENRIIAENTK